MVNLQKHNLMFKTTFFFVIILSVFSCQDYGNLDKKGGLSRNLAEVSGLAIFKNDTLIYTAADHGNPNYIYGLDSSGNIQREIVISNALNEDWEDLTTDPNGTLYISDTGNNENEREDQFIYIVENFASLVATSDTLQAKRLTFTLSDQKDYPPDLNNLNFDIEALLYKDGSLYMFTRNRSRHFDGTTKVYKLPARPGTYQAQLIDQYVVCDNLNTCAVTGVALSPKGDRIALLTSDKILMLSEFKGENFFSGKIKTYDLDYTSPKEGIAFKNDSTLYIVDERRAQTGGNLYEYSLTGKNTP